MAALEEDLQEKSPIATKPIISPINNNKNKAVVSESDNSSSAKKSLSRKDYILSVARKTSAQVCENFKPGVWAVLTAISKNARTRPQGMNILLTNDEHCIGRLVAEKELRIDSAAVSGMHCRIFRKEIPTDNQASNFCISVFLVDTSSNGTYLNWQRLKKNELGNQVHHGDIISFAGPPEHDSAFTFVYREVSNSTSSAEGAGLKRKSGECASKSKRQKGIGIGAPDGPISLDDVRSLQRSNKELRKQLESHVLTIETTHNENREAVARHENELKELKESVSQAYLNEIKDLRQTLEVKQNELIEITAVSSERQQSIVDLNERLIASMQSRSDADDIINSQKATIAEHEKQLDEERNQRREEREKSLADQKAALHRAHLEAQEELKRHADNASRQERELNEVITKLQDSDKESRQLVENLRSKLEEARDNLVISEEKVRQLEVQVQVEQHVSSRGRKNIETLETEVERLREELDSEKVAREEAWAKISALELEMAAAIRDLSVEKQRFQGARERIFLRETQLRSFYSTTEEITSLFTKQQEQLKAMQRTLEDEENYDNMSFDIDENTTKENINEAIITTKQRLTTTTPVPNRSGQEEEQVESTSDEASVTEKHECGNHTQEVECTSKAAFGSEVDGVGTVPVLDETERVVETEPAGEDTEVEGVIRTADLVTSEVAGSWAVSTAPSGHGENDSVQDDVVVVMSEGDGQADGSQVREALGEMIGIVAPEFKERFGGGGGGGGEEEEEEGESVSDSDTQAGSENEGGGEGDVNDAVGGSMSVEDTEEGSDVGDDVMDDERQEDSLG